LRGPEFAHDLLVTVGDEEATAASGADALEVVPVFQPDVILTDMLMPGMSGRDLEAATYPFVNASARPISHSSGAGCSTMASKLSAP
jgi:FixJ family two-component response regulator